MRISKTEDNQLCSYYSLLSYLFGAFFVFFSTNLLLYFREFYHLEGLRIICALN